MKQAKQSKASYARKQRKKETNQASQTSAAHREKTMNARTQHTGSENCTVSYIV